MPIVSNQLGYLYVVESCAPREARIDGHQSISRAVFVTQSLDEGRLYEAIVTLACPQLDAFLFETVFCCCAQPIFS